MDMQTFKAIAKEDATRAEKWAFSSSTINGVAVLAGLAIGGGTDATTGFGWQGVAIGLAVAGLTAIFMPQASPATVGMFVNLAEGLEAKLAASHAVTTKAAAGIETASAALAVVAPKLDATAVEIAKVATTLAPVAEAALTVAGQPAAAKIVTTMEVIGSDVAATKIAPAPAGTGTA